VSFLQHAQSVRNDAKKTEKVASRWCDVLLLGRMRMLRWLLHCWVHRSRLRQPVMRQMCLICLSTLMSRRTASVIKCPMEKWLAATITTYVTLHHLSKAIPFLFWITQPEWTIANSVFMNTFIHQRQKVYIQLASALSSSLVLWCCLLACKNLLKLSPEYVFVDGSKPGIILERRPVRKLWERVKSYAMPEW